MDELIKALNDINASGIERDHLVMELIGKVVTEMNRLADIVASNTRMLSKQYDLIDTLRNELDELKHVNSLEPGFETRH